MKRHLRSVTLRKPFPAQEDPSPLRQLFDILGTVIIFIAELKIPLPSAQDQLENDEAKAG